MAHMNSVRIAEEFWAAENLAIENHSNRPAKNQHKTLDLLILRTLMLGPAHGHQIAKHIQRSTSDVLQVEHGSLYPALHRLERKGWLGSKWESREGKREFKYYRLSAAGRKQLVVEESKWK
jgi:PadR family transcriptional regulator PadR